MLRAGLLSGSAGSRTGRGRQQRQCRADFTGGLRSWHHRAREIYREWPEASELAFEAATGAVHEITLGRVALGHAEVLPELTDELVTVQLALLHVPPDAA